MFALRSFLRTQAAQGTRKKAWARVHQIPPLRVAVLPAPKMKARQPAATDKQRLPWLATPHDQCSCLNATHRLAGNVTMLRGPTRSPAHSEYNPCERERGSALPFAATPVCAAVLLQLHWGRRPRLDRRGRRQPWHCGDVATHTSTVSRTCACSCGDVRPHFPALLTSAAAITHMSAQTREAALVTPATPVRCTTCGFDGRG